MAKKNQPKTGNEQKVQTKYERKMEQRRIQEEKNKREAKMTGIVTAVVTVLFVLIIAGSIAVSFMNKWSVTKDTYITVGNHEITKVEYDYYYSASYNQYSSLLSSMGMGVDADFESQPYSDTMTMKDYFDQTAVEQIKQIKALTDDAQANGFTYDVTADYETMLTSLEAGAESTGVTLAEFYKATYGEYATEKNMEPFIKEGLLASAYYEHLKEQNAPTEQEIKDRYHQNVQEYDKVDYKTFVISADIAEGATEEDTAKAMEEAKAKADAMLAAIEGGADFREQCLEYATEDEKAKYEDTENDASVREGAYYSTTSSAIADWLYAEGRTAGERVVLEDTTNNRYYILEFIQRYYDEADNATISDTIATERTTEYENKLKESYTVVDNKGELVYLTLDTAVTE